MTALEIVLVALSWLVAGVMVARVCRNCPKDYEVDE